MRRPKRLLILKTPDGVDDALRHLSEGPLALDTETTGLDWWTDRVGAICLAAGTTAIFCYKAGLGPAARYLRDQIKARRTFVFHNSKFDMHMCRTTFGLHFPYPVHDTYIQSYLLDNRGVRGGHHLKDLAAHYVDPRAHDPERDLLAAIRAAGGTHKGDWLLAPENLFASYGALDPWYTLQLHLQFIPRLKHWVQPADCPSLWSLYQTERWCTLALRDMEARGICVDPDYLARWKTRLDTALRRREQKLAQLAGRTINWSSPDELAHLLYTQLKLQPHHFTKGGKPSTDEAALLSLTHPIGRELHLWRKDRKQSTSYAESLPRHIRSDGAIHPSFKQMIRTGRMSCSEPNMQQQTRESGVRNAFIARKGVVLRFADFSQVEMRFAAHFANEPFLVEGFNHDPNFDTHAATAKAMYGLTGEPSKRQRKFGKIINFATLFGAGEDRVRDSLLDMIDANEAIEGCKELGYRVRRGEDAHRSLAQLIRQRYFKMLPGMRKVTKDVAREAQQNGFCVNAFGRHRYFDDERWYSAFNTIVQGSAADAAKRGLVAMYRELQLRDGVIGLMLQIHDEEVYESDGDPKTDRRVLELLRDDTSFRIPIIADISGSDTTWQNKVTVKL